MKITAEHFATLETAVRRIQTENPTITAEAYAAAGRSAKRYRWDCLWAAVRLGYVAIGQGHHAPAEPERAAVYLPVYDYADDSHIDTALRKITGTK